MRLFFYGIGLTLFGLLAVYSTSIFKSFNQGVTININKNIERIASFESFIDITAGEVTQNFLNQLMLQWMTEIWDSSIDWEELIVADLEFASISYTASKQDLDELEFVASGKKYVKQHNNYALFFNQIRSLIVALLVALIVFLLPIWAFQNTRFVYFLFFASVALQLLVFIPIFQVKNGISAGWIDFWIPGIPNIQPAEVLKLAYILFMSHRLLRKKDEIDDRSFLIKFGVINALMFVIFLAIPDFGTLIILVITVSLMARYAGLKARKIWLLAIIAIGVAFFSSGMLMLINPNYNYVQQRLVSFFDRNPDSVADRKLKEDWQIEQALIAVWGGGFWGQGYGKGLQKMGYLPEAYSDFIFAAFAEEIWFLWNMLLLALYAGIFFYVLRRLPKIRDPYSRVIAVGVLSLIMVQAFVNMGVNLRILPNTGLTLPFVSHGGTALMINFVELMLLYKILQNK